ncbi:MAG: hypothetical protein WCK70_14710 [Chloroflexales bacterium]|jgi:hypothetical protein
MRLYQFWTDEEIAFLTAYYDTMSVKEMMLSLNRSKVSIQGMVRRLGLESGRTKATQVINHSYFSRIRTAEQAYILGLLATDGTVDSTGKIRLTLHEQDRGLVEWVRDRIAPLSPVHPQPGRQAILLQITTPQMAADLSGFGVVPNKTSSLEWPSSLDNEWYRPFLLGAFDGDGSLHYNKRILAKSTLRWALYGAEAFLSTAAIVIEQATGIKPYGPRRMHTERKGHAIELAAKKAETVDYWLNQDRMGWHRKHLQ